ncbi:FRG domain-containing protein [Peribacillus frigoritolerans]|uniref:FRG domain-containing protein n=1 Tax=Peribacillus frigoritolerans TaxID=450367 RepID=UPI00222ECEBE|nr:FRG domain-containing protein [Peribacillus frigoritolerans]UZD48704.1 FRG domain-containing protein [Peribacillus frigoritolerans]
MDLTSFSILKEEIMKNEILESEPKYYLHIYQKHREELLQIEKEFKKDILENKYDKILINDKDRTLLDNIIYLLEGINFIEGKSDEEQIDIKKLLELDTYKNLKLCDLINIGFEFQDGKMNIEIQELKTKIDEMEKNNIWNEASVEETIKQKYLIENSENVKMINSLSEYTQFINELEINLSNGLVSRGQKDCSYDLSPSLYRIYKKRQDVHAKGYEQTFKQRIAYYSKDSGIKSDEELRAEGQHFGLPTEYLDFTEAHIISLLFAIEDYNYKGNHSIVFFIDSAAFNKHSVNKDEKLINLQFQGEREYLSRYNSCSYFIKLPNINERIHFQKGCFLRVSHQDCLDKNKDLIENLKDKCGIAIINKSCKEEILKELFTLGITFESIYPDKDNLVKSIRFNYEIMQGGKGR